ncbi:MAG: PVC-type heme-binding CxxCH protein, partial [Gemmataceae bacterium]
FILAPGFEVNLFAADPMLAKPLQMNFDPAGRLWVATSEVYPQIKPGQKANDKIIILEDTNRDGVADKTRVFADGLLIPTGIEPGDGGAYIANSTELIHLKSSTPDGKADQTRVLLSGFGTEDTHHIIHTFRWGPEQALYFNQSIYIHSHLETPKGVKRLNAGGIWRYWPEQHDIDVFARGWVNSWGHHHDQFGQSFATDGAGGEGINHAVPGASYVTAYGANRILHGLNPGSPKYCGLEIVSGRHLPEDWQGDLLTNDFRGHRVCRFKLRDDGSTYESREQQELIKTSHPAFRPIDIKMGPDGAIYIADWYNPIIQHGEVDFRDPRRDHVHGRIWRITAKNRALVPPVNLPGMPNEELVKQLLVPEQQTRQQVKRLLKERGTSVLPAVGAWAGSLPPTAEQPRLEALWVQLSHGTTDVALLDSVLKASNPDVRAGALRVLRMSGLDEAMIAARVIPALKDPSARVRLEAVRVLPRLNTAAAAETAAGLLDLPMDGTLDYALWLTLRELEAAWLPAFREGTVRFGGDARKIAFALNASGSSSAAQALLTLARSPKSTPTERAGMWQLLAQLGSTNELPIVLNEAKPLVAAEAWPTLLGTLEESLRVRKVNPGSATAWATLDTELDDARPAVRQSAARLVGLVKRDAMRATLEKQLQKPDAAPADVQAALDGLLGLGGSKTRTTLDQLIASTGPVTVRSAAVAALASLELSAASKQTVKLLQDPSASG